MEPLTSSQASALLNILTHHEIYRELQDLRFPGALGQSGPPWRPENNAKTFGTNSLPLLQKLFKECITTLPGLREVTPDFWQVKCQVLVDDLASSNLSESYEAGYIGIRKTFATAAAAMLEGPARGFFAGCSKQDLRSADGSYDRLKPEDIMAAWDDLQQEVVYGDLIQKVFHQASQTDSLNDHTALVQAAHEYILVIVASFLHYILIVSSEGYTILSMMKTANNLVPYRAIKSALRIGNVASMISALSRILLAKISINTITSFIGLTNSSDSGMNLVQTTLSTMINWDTNELKTKVANIAKCPDGFSMQQRGLLDHYIGMSIEERQKCKTLSEVRCEPIVVTIMDEYGGLELSARQVTLALEYLSLEISIHDRQKICDVLCSRQPDLLTQAIREGITAYEPIIRALHNAVDLSGTIGDVDHFLEDLFKLCLSNNNAKKTPSVEDFILLLRTHQTSVHTFVHQVCKNGPQLSTLYKEYGQFIAKEFQSSSGNGGAGTFTKELNSAVANLSMSQRAQVLAECTAHAEYLDTLQADTKKRFMTAIVPREIKHMLRTPHRTSSFQTMLSSSRNNSRTSSPERSREAESYIGPGTFLRRWQAYIDTSTITPAGLDQPVRYGGDESVVNAGRARAEGVIGKRHTDTSQAIRPPRCEKTIDMLSAQFRDMLRSSKQST